MVATRSHPNDFPPPGESPTKRTTRSESTATTSALSFSPKISSTTTSTAFQSTRPRTMASLNHTPIRRDAAHWRHKVPAITIPWLTLSLPLVIWDTIYIMGRPHTFAGGAIAWPMYKPYELYGRVDPVYSPEAYYSGLGWTGAQGLGNVFETLAYVAYLWIVMVHGQEKGRGEGVLGSLGVIGKKRAVEGDWAAIASLVGYTTFMITVAKSVLYWYNDAFMGFPIWNNNTWFNFVFVFAIPNFAWILVPSYLSYIFAVEILEGLTFATGVKRKVR